MEHFLLCFQCGKLYDEEEGRSSYVGECSHSICSLCYSMLTNTSDCPICKTHYSFSEPNNSILNDAKCLKKKMTEYNFRNLVENKRQNLLRKSCFECSQRNTKPRICVDCVKESGILMKKLEDKNWIVQFFHEDFTNAPFICSTCVFKKHEEHKTVNLQQIINLLEVIAFECYLKFLRKDNTKAGFYERRIKEYEAWMTFYKVYTTDEKDLFEEMKDVPEKMKDCSRKSRSELQKLGEKVIKLKQRELLLYQEFISLNIQEFQELIEEIDNDESRENFTVELTHLMEISEKIGKNVNEFQLKETEIGEIDEEIVSRMEKLEESYKKGVLVLIKQSEDSMFYKYQALLEEFQKTESIRYQFGIEEYNIKLGLILMKKEKFEEVQMTIDALKERKEPVERDNDLENQIFQWRKCQSFLQMELIEDDTQLNQSTINLFKKYERLNYFELMRLKFFPILPFDDFEKAAYDRFITDFIYTFRTK